MRSRIAWLLAAAAVLVAVLLYLAGAGSGKRADRPTHEEESDAGPPAREGGAGGGAVDVPRVAAPAAAPGAGAAGVLQGEVRDGNGPVPGALLYLLPKGSPGTDDQNAVQIARADVEGRFTMRDARPRGCWLGVVAERHRPRFQDGDALPPAPLLIALDAGYELEVAFGAPENVTVRKVLLRVSTAPGVAAFRFPGPDAQPRLNLAGHADVDEPRVFVVEGPGPYDVAMEGDGLHWEPGTQRVELPGRAFFQLFPSATILVEVVDAASGEPYRDGGVLAAANSSGPVEGLSTRGRSLWVLQRHLLPGTYDLEFRAPGYRPWRTQVRIDDPGARVGLQAPLERDPAVGEIRVKGITAAGAAVRRSGGTEWVLPHLERRGEGLSRLLGIEAGTVDALLWDARGDQVAVVTAVAVPGGGVAEAKAALLPGRIVEPAALGVEAGSELHVESDALGGLPFLVPGGGLPSVGLAWPSSGPPVGRIGPYPHVPDLRLVEKRGARVLRHALGGGG